MHRRLNACAVAERCTRIMNMSEQMPIEQFLTNVECNCCKSRHTKSVFLCRERFAQKYPIPGLKDYLFSIVKCTNCGLIYVNPRITNSTLEDIYEKCLVSEDDFREKTIDPFTNPFLAKLHTSLEIIHPAGKLLDIGCGWGHLLTYFSSHGWDVTGIEIDEMRYQHCLDQNLNIINRPLHEIEITEGTYDLITSVQVMEHLPDPLGTIRWARKALKPCGIFVVEVPNYLSISSIRHKRDWHILHPVEHIYYYTYGSMKALLNAGGFITIHKPSPVNHFLEINPLLEKATLLMENWLGIFIDNLTLFARKSR